MGCNIFFGGGRGLCQKFFVRKEFAHDLIEFSVLPYRESSSMGYQFQGFMEFPVIGAENHRYAKNSRFQCVVYPGPESPADIGYLAKTI